MPVHRHPVANPKATRELSRVPLDRTLAARLEATFAQVRASGIRFGEVFYERLFAAAPQVRPMFRSDPAAQTQKLVAAMDAIVRNLNSPEENADMIAALGRRHAEYGARPEHYDLVIGLLVDAMAEVLGPSADIANLEEWRTVLRLVSDQMIAAGKPPPAN